MSNTDLETTMCEDCQTPIATPKLVHVSPFFAFRPSPLCKDCLLKIKAQQFEHLKFKPCPFKIPYWRPKP